MYTTRVTDLVPFFSAMADRTRLRIINLLRGGEVCVCFFVEILGEGQPKISRHLAYLRRAGVVQARRDGKWIHYSLTRPEDAQVAALLDAALHAIEHDRQMQRDRLALERACCAAKLPPALQHAPRPNLNA